MEEKFTIIITGTENYTWHGAVRRGGEELPFSSELELLWVLDRLLPERREDARATLNKGQREGGADQWRPI